MVTGARVDRLETDPTGRTVTGVVAELADGERVGSPPTSWWSPAAP